MGVALVLIVLALAVGVLGLIVSALKWVLIIAAALFIAGAVAGWLRRSKAA